MALHFLLWRRKSIWLLTGAAIAIVFTGHSLIDWHLSSTLAVAWITIALVGFVYGMDSLTDFEHPLKALVSKAGLKLLPLLFSGLLLAYWRGHATVVSALAILILGFSYSYPINTSSGVFRLKSLTGIKSAWIGVGWALLVYLGAGTFEMDYAHWAAAFVSLQVMAGSVLRDLDDLEEDRISGTRTLPLVLGENATYAFLHALNLSSGLMLFFMPLPWALWWLIVLAWRAVNLEWLRLGSPGRYATQYMNLATCGVIFFIRMVFYVLD